MSLATRLAPILAAQEAEGAGWRLAWFQAVRDAKLAALLKAKAELSIADKALAAHQRKMEDMQKAA